MRLAEIATYVNEKISSSNITLDQYVTTDSLLQDKRGREYAQNLPPVTTNLIHYQPGDILVANIRPYLKKVWFADCEGGASSDVLVIRAKTPNDTTFVYALLMQDSFYDYAMKGAKGSKMPRGDKDQIMRYEFPIFSPEQRLNIGKFITDIESKIAVNRQINDNLEAIAKQLYDYWFVQFDFPNEEGKPYKSSGGKMVWNDKLKREIPEGWEVEKLGDIIQELESGKRPKGGIEKSLRQGIPSLGAEAISKLGDFDYSKTPYIPYNTKINSGIIKNNDILIYKDGAYVGKVTLYRDNFPFEFATINEHVFLLRTTDPKTQEYTFFTLQKDYFFNIMQNLGKAKAAQPGLNKDDLKSIEILSPTKEIVYKYRTIIEPLMANLFNSAKQIANLTKHRDELLPLLMNGQVSVNYHLSHD
jgi:type I restriction enzyme S subunit